MNEFKPRAFQKEVFDEIVKTPRKTLLQLPRVKRYVGVDIGQKGGDKTVIAQFKKTPKGITAIYFDEYADMPDYRWYRNPIKWWKWRRLWKRIERQAKKAKKAKKGKPWTNSIPF